MTYNEFINNWIETYGQWHVPEDGIYEKHHIKFACKGGLGDYQSKDTDRWCFKKNSHHTNCVYLPPEQHYEAHRLAYLEHPDDVNVARAWLMMAFPKGKTKRDKDGHELPITAEDYRLLRIIAKETDARNKLPAWNKGLTKETDARVKQYSEALSQSKKGITKGPDSDITRERKSISAKRRYEEHPESFVSGTKNKLSVNNGDICFYINKDDELPEGFKYGQGERNSYIIKDKEAYSLIRSKLTSGENNPMHGKGDKVSGGKNGHADTSYIFENIEYDCRKSLLDYLNSNGYNISIGIFRSICLGNYSKKTADKYKYIIDNLVSRKKDED